MAQLFALKTVAERADSTGKHRVRITPMSDLREWSVEDRDELCALESKYGGTATILGPLSRAEYDSLAKGL